MNILTIVRLIAGVAIVCALLLVLVLPYWKIFRKAGFSPWLSLLIWVPLVNLIILYTVAYSDWKIEATVLKEDTSPNLMNARKSVGWLFPWRKLFRRLELEKRWWHRLAIVGYFVSLLSIFLFSWGLASDIYRPSNSYNQEITYLPSTGAPLPSGAVVGAPSSNDGAPKTLPPEVFAEPSQKSIEMPDGKTETYPGTTSDEAIKTDWQHRLDTEQIEQFILGLTIAACVTLCFAYLLQFAYRALLYIIYGSSRVIQPSDASARQTSTETIS